ncbi:MAG: hypothetical protein QM564_10300 [Bergeyella sp.]
METTAKKTRKQTTAKPKVKKAETVEAAEPRKISKTWEAVLRAKEKPLIEIVDMRAVLK